MLAIPWMTPTAPAPAAPVVQSPGVLNPGPDPTTGFATGMNPQGYMTGPMSQADLQRWADYFASPGLAPGGSGGGAPGGAGGTTNQLVQTGASWTPAIPWLTAAAGQPSDGLNIPIQAVGIQPGATMTQTAANVANSPFAGDPSNPYYKEILNQIASGTIQPTYTSVPVAAPTSPSYAQLVGGQLYGNPTPEETALLQYFQTAGGGGDFAHLPALVQAALASTQGPSPLAPGQVSGSLQAQAAATWNLLHPDSPYNPAYDYAGTSPTGYAYSGGS